MVRLTLIPIEAFRRVRSAPIAQGEKLKLIADMCRANTLTAVKCAGSGHVGTSFSAMDIVVWLYEAYLNTIAVGLSDPNRDIYLSSKGHDVPGLYSVLYAHGVIPRERFLKLRRLGGLDGHPDVRVPGIEANSGSLGMGISKGRGIAWAKRFLGRGGRVVVMTGDGEWQEGQNFEALQAAAHQQVSNLTVIIDHNKVQSDRLVREIMDLGDLEGKLRSFGWHTARCDGHDVSQLERVFTAFDRLTDRPKILLADTIKGRGISFMEHPEALRAGGGLYRWHAGAPDDESFANGFRELRERLDASMRAAGLPPLAWEDVSPEQTVALQVAADSLEGEPASAGAVAPAAAVSDEYVAEAFGQALAALGKTHPNLVVLDADLEADCRLRAFRAASPDRFIENGIAEQDMVSMAGGLARHGLLPVVNSFANFLAARANEQIYANACEGTKIIYACHYAGLIPAGPGKSHQSLRDISLLGALPSVLIMQPCNALEAVRLTEYCVEEAATTCVIRLNIGPSPRRIVLPDGYRPVPGQGVVLAEGQDAMLVGYGPVMLHEALIAHDVLRKQDMRLKVVNMPWLNRVDPSWLEETVEGCPALYVLEDHAPFGGLADTLLRTLAAGARLAERPVIVFGVEGQPACGTAHEALQYHKLDGASLAGRILEHLTKSRPGRLAGVGALRSTR